jgi:putative methyltransferase (TIGR04325 family)
MSWIIKIKQRLKKRRKRISFSGHFQSWKEAQEKSAGYDAAIILERTKAALLKVLRGEAAYERDSVTFTEIEHSFPVLAALLRTAVQTGGRLAVLDFGGALGSSYFQCREFLSPVKRLVWTVVEQSAHVECGKLYFQTEQLRFHRTVEESLKEEPADILLVSSVIQYVPEPYNLLAGLLANKIRHVIIDRTAFLQRDQDRLTIQTVPEAIYDASYPAWFLSETKLREYIDAAGYRIVAEFPAIDNLSPDDEHGYHKGFILELITPAEPTRT